MAEEYMYRVFHNDRHRIIEIARYNLKDGKPIEGAEPESVAWITEEKLIEIIRERGYYWNSAAVSEGVLEKGKWA